MKLIRALVIKGTNLRERAKHRAALAVLDRALRLALGEKDFASAVDALGARCLTWKHLHQLTEDKAYMALAQSDAWASLLIVQAKGLKKLNHSAHFNVAKIAVIAKDFDGATAHYRTALKYYRGSRTERGDYRCHYGEALFRAGQRTRGLRTIQAGLQEIQKHRGEVDSFLAHVWESGAHMRLTELLWREERTRAREYLRQAQTIIKSDNRLLMRKKQLHLLTQRILK